MADSYEKIQRNFLWSGLEEKNKLSLVSWEEVCKPKAKRGLGVRRLGYLNKTLLTKVGWRLVEKNTDWSNIMKAKYLSNSSFIYHLFNNNFPRGSKIWMNITRSRGMLREGVRWIIGNGHSIRFWEDNCMGGKPLAYNKFIRLMEKLKVGVWTRVEDYIDPRRKWKKLRQDNCTLKDIQLVKYLEDLMEAQRLPILIHEDKFVWEITPNGQFTIKSAYNLLFNKDHNLASWRKVWINNLLPKINFF